MKLLKNGNFLILVSASLFGLGGLCVKMISWDALSINAARCGIASLMLVTYLLLTRQSLKVTRGTILGALCVFGTTNLYIFANKLTTAANAILIQYAAPVFIILITWIAFRERPRRMDIITGLVVFAGIGCFVMDGLAGGRMLGNLLALLSGVTFAGVFMMNRIPGGDSFSSTIIGQFLAFCVGLPSLLGETDFGSTSVTFVLIMGLFQMGTGYLLFCIGIKKTAPVTASLLSGVEPIINPLLVAIVVGEMISPLSAVGGVIVLGAVTVYNVLLVRRRPMAEDLEAVEALREEILNQEGNLAGIASCREDTPR
jgi:drug/metabolite transporter (DMT)-like permease